MYLQTNLGKVYQFSKMTSEVNGTFYLEGSRVYIHPNFIASITNEIPEPIVIDETYGIFDDETKE